MRHFTSRATLILSVVAIVQARSVGAQSSSSPASSAPMKRQAMVLVVSQAALVRASLLQGTPVPERAVSLRGVDLAWLPARVGFGAHARIAQSSLGSADLSMAELGLSLGGGAFSVEGTVGQRAGYSPTSGLMHDQSYPYARAGVRSQRFLGNTRFSVSLRGGVLFGVGEAEAEPVEGWEGETQVSWTAPRIPLRAMVGYRIERFAVAGVEQEVSALLIGFGVVRGMPR